LDGPAYLAHHESLINHINPGSLAAFLITGVCF